VTGPDRKGGSGDGKQKDRNQHKQRPLHLYLSFGLICLLKFTDAPCFAVQGVEVTP
jgi:hypothetical protein